MCCSQRPAVILGARGDCIFSAPFSVTRTLPVGTAGKNWAESGILFPVGRSFCVALRQKISRYYQNNFSITVPPEQIVITPGASGALQLVLSYVLQMRKGINRSRWLIDGRCDHEFFGFIIPGRLIVMVGFMKHM